MPKPLLTIFLMAAVLFFSGCATPVSEADRASIKTIAVVTDLAPELKFHTMGVLPIIQKKYSNQSEAISVSDTAEAIVTQALISKGYTVKPVSEDFRAFAKKLIEDQFSEREVGILTSYAKDFDAVVFIVSQQNQGAYGETGFGGIEVVPSNVFGLKSMLIECNTGLFICSTSLAKQIGADVEARGLMEVSDVEWKERWDELSPTDQQKIVSDLKATIETAIKPKIDKLL